MLNKKLFLLQTCLGLALWLECSGSMYASSWPGFRGPDRDGVAAKTEKPPIYFNPSSNLLWKAELPPGLSSPVIWNNQVFLTGAEDNKLTTVCFDATSGMQRWRTNV